MFSSSDADMLRLMKSSERLLDEQTEMKGNQYKVISHLWPVRSRPVSHRYFAGALRVCRSGTLLVFHTFSFHFLGTMSVLVLELHCYLLCKCPSHCSLVLQYDFQVFQACSVSDLICILSLQIVPSILCCHLWCAIHVQPPVASCWLLSAVFMAALV